MAKKHAKRKRTKQEEAKQKEKSVQKTFPNKYLWAGIVLVLILAFLFLKLRPGNKVLAEVNGEKIIEADLEKQYQRIPLSSRENVDKRALLEQTINEALILQQAERLGIEITKQEVETILEQALQQSGITEEEFETRLQEEGLTREQILEGARRQSTIAAVVRQQIQLTVTEEEARQFYEQNKAQFEGKPFTEVQSALIRVLSSQRSQAMLNAYLQQLRDQAEIQVYAENLE